MADSAPQTLRADGILTALSGFANTVGEILHSGSVIPRLHNKIAGKADQRKQPGQYYQPYKGEQDAVCQHGMGAIPTVEHCQHGHGVQQRDGHPRQRGQPGEKRQDAKPGDHQKSDHVSLEVRINKEVRNYQESLFFGLSLRQLLFALLAVAVAVGVYFGLRPVLGNGEIGWVCVLAAFPFALGGFFQYNGMTLERFLLAYIRSEFLFPRRLVFKSDNIYAKALENSTIKEALKLD